MSNYPDAADEPRDVATLRYNAALIQSFDDQILGLARDVVPRRNASWTSAFPKADPDAAALQMGTVVALIGTKKSESLMVAATAANLAVGARVFGILVATTAPGQRGEVAVGGLVPSSITGVSGGAGVVGANAATGMAERGSTNGVVGMSNAGNATLVAPPPGAQTQMSVDLEDGGPTLTGFNDDVLLVYTSVSFSSDHTLDISAPLKKRVTILCHGIDSQPHDLYLSPMLGASPLNIGDTTTAQEFVWVDLTAVGGSSGWLAA